MSSVTSRSRPPTGAGPRRGLNRLLAPGVALLVVLSGPLGFLAGGAGRLPRSIAALELAPVLGTREVWEAFDAPAVRWSAEWALRWDFAFIATYVALLAAVSWRLLARRALRRACIAAAVLAGILDVGENLLLLRALNASKAVEAASPAMVGACVLALAKFALLLGVGLACAAALVGRLRARAKAHNAVAGPQGVARGTLGEALVVIDRASDALRPVWFHVLLVLGIDAAMLVVAQAQDVIRSIGEASAAGHGSVRPGLILLAATCLWAWTAWFWSRFLLTAKLAQEPDLMRHRESRWLLEWMPRLLAFAAFAGVGFAFWRGSFDGLPRDRDGWRGDVFVWGCIFIAAGLASVSLLAGRRWLLGRAHSSRMVPRQLRPAVPPAPAPGQQTVSRLRQLFVGTSPRVAIALSVAAFVLPMGAFTWAPVASGARVNAAAALALAGAAWIPLGSLVAWLGRTWGVPVFRWLVVWALVISAVNDNHTLQMARSESKVRQPTLEARVSEWLAHQHGRDRNERRHRLYLVAAEGGGIRAAAWTAAVLGSLQERSRGRFADQLFAVSSVSGGSLGAAVFAAQVAQGTPHPQVLEESERMFSEDLLAAGWGALLFPDALQRLLPVAVLPDRAAALEASWEKAWTRRVADGRAEAVDFASPFLDLWKPRQAHTFVPSLLLNATSVETGGRLIVSDLDVVPREEGKTASLFAHALDGVDVTGPGLRLSSAAHLGARFPYISPAATLPDGGHAVDGGYYENRGAATLHDVLTAIQGVLADKDAHPVEIVVIQLAYDATKEERPPAPLSDLLAPAQALFNTLNGRGEHATAQLAAEAGNNVRFLSVRLRQRDVPMPLGWMLSELARRDIYQQAREVLGWEEAGAVCPAQRRDGTCASAWKQRKADSAGTAERDG